MNKTAAAEDNPLYLAERLEQQAAIQSGKGEPDRAANLLKQALELKQKVLGAGDPAVADTLDALGCAYLSQQNYAASVETIKQAKEIMEKAYYPEHAAVAPAIEHLADCYIEQDKLAEAEPLLKKLLEIHQKTSRGERLDILQAMRKLVHLYQKTGKWADAEALLKKAVQAADSPWGPVEDFLYDQGLTFKELGKDTDAEASFKKAIDAYRQRHKNDGLIKSLKAYAELLQKMGRPADADKMLSQANQLSRQLAV